MRFWLNAVGLAGAIALAAGSATRATTQCQMQELAELPVNVDGPMNTIEAQIDGQPARMLVDTGSTFPFLFWSGAARLKLTPAQIPGYTEVYSYGVGGKTQESAVRIKELKVGDLVARNLDMFLNGQGFGGVDGVLGASFLLQTDVEFDLPEGKIRFFKAKDCAGDQVVYWGKAYSVAPMVGDNPRQIVVIISLNGTPIRTLMDTGASTSVVTPEAAARAGITPKSSGGGASPTIRGLGPQAVRRSGVGVFPTFAFGADETIRNAKVEIADLFHADKESAIGSNIPVSTIQEQMLLGSDFFRAHRVYVSKSQGKVYVSYMGGPVFQIPGAPSPAPVTAPAAK
jgi:predicted aspartyl protease